MLMGRAPFAGNSPSEIFRNTCHGRLGLGRGGAGLWDKLPSAARELIVGLMQLDHNLRFTGEQAMSHRWLAMPDDQDKLDVDGDGEGKGEGSAASKGQKQQQQRASQEGGGGGVGASGGRRRREGSRTAAATVAEAAEAAAAVAVTTPHPPGVWRRLAAPLASPPRPRAALVARQAQEVRALAQ